MRIAIIDDYIDIALTLVDWSSIASRAGIVAFNRPFADEDDIVASLAGFDIVVTLRERTPFPATLLRRLTDLKYLVVTGQRYDTVDIATAAEMGIAVSNTGFGGGRNGAGGWSAGERRGGNPVTELVWGLMLSLARDIPREARLMRQGEWQHGAGITLKGKTLGILGLGNLGREVARGGAFFGMNVLAWSQNLTPAAAAEGGATYVSKEELFSRSDFVTVHLALSERTAGIVGAREFGLMKPRAYLINTARAQIVDETALLDALESRKIAGAALDVYSVEPLPADHKLRTLDNVVLTPHLGYFTREGLTVFYEGAIAAIDAYLRGAPINIVNGVRSDA